MLYIDNSGMKCYSILVWTKYEFYYLIWRDHWFRDYEKKDCTKYYLICGLRTIFNQFFLFFLLLHLAFHDYINTNFFFKSFLSFLRLQQNKPMKHHALSLWLYSTLHVRKLFRLVLLAAFLSADRLTATNWPKNKW